MLHTDLDQPVRGSASTMNNLLFAVCDGIGGEVAGEAASFMGVETIKGDATGYTDLEYMIKNMNQKVCEYARNHHISSMGSTAAILKMKGGVVQGANVGDSTIFLFRDGKLKKMTVDHVAKGIFCKKPPLTQCLGIEEGEMLLEPHLFQEKCRKKDYYLICSDGVTDLLNENEIADIIKENVELEQIINVLKRWIYEAGATDNATMICCKID